MFLINSWCTTEKRQIKNKNSILLSIKKNQNAAFSLYNNFLTVTLIAAFLPVSHLSGKSFTKPHTHTHTLSRHSPASSCQVSWRRTLMHPDSLSITAVVLWFTVMSLHYFFFLLLRYTSRRKRVTTVPIKNDTIRRDREK